MEIKFDQLGQQVVQSIYAIQDWGYPLIQIMGRIYVVDGDIEMSDEFNSIAEHYFYGKDITAYIMNHGAYLSAGQEKNAFIDYLNVEIKRRKFRFHKDERYVRYSV